MIVHTTAMDLSLVIDRHHKQLTRIVGTLFAMIGLTTDEPVERVSRPLYLAILRLLRPAESAVRRLIVAAAQSITLKSASPCSVAAKRTIASERKTSAPRPPAFQLFDPRQRFNTNYRLRRMPMPADFNRPQPRVRVLDVGFDPRIPFLRQALPPPLPTPEPDETVSARQLCRRLFAIKAALDDLPRQAMRYARWQSRPAGKRRPQRTSALRTGRPPGHRKDPRHKVDEILNECDWLARHASQPDTS